MIAERDDETTDYWEPYDKHRWDEAWENPARGDGPTSGASSSSAWAGYVVAQESNNPTLGASSGSGNQRKGKNAGKKM